MGALIVDQPPLRKSVGLRLIEAVEADPGPVTIQDGLLAASGVHQATKRVLDIVVASAALLLLAPLMLLVALAVRLTSPGPALYVQDRIGRDGTAFKFYKFRSMRRLADDELAQLAADNEATGPVFKMRRDPRITPVGRVIRKLSIDELPQLVSVLTGRMSLVGPRPPLPHEVADYDTHQHQRLAVTPGLTCIWQVSGRSDICFDEWVEMDLAYIRNWSLALDLRILLLTLPAVVSGRGAY